MASFLPPFSLSSVFLAPSGGLGSGLVSYWKMDEASGTRIDSVIATGNDLTDNNTCPGVAGKIGNAANFTAANSETLSRANNGSLQVGGVDFAVAFWTRPTSLAATSVIASKNNNSAGGEWEASIDAGTGVMHFSIMQGGAVQLNLSGPAISAGAFHLIVCTFTLSSLTGAISVDNSNFTTGVASIAPANTATGFQIGGRTSALFYNGDVDEMGFWKSRVLSQADVGTLWNGGAGITYPL